MEQRAASDHAKPAARYVVADARYAARSNRLQSGAPRPPAAGLTSPVPSSAAGPAPIQRPRVRMRRAPPGTLRFETQAMYDVDAAPAAAELEFDDDFQLDEELKMDFDRSVRAHRRPQRIKYVKCKTRVLPDLLVPYLYAGDRRSRMNAIMDRTGCTIDYCPESPDDDIDMLRPQRVGNLYLMCFLVAAETTGQLEAATRLLHVLVDRVQEHVEYKLTSGSARRASEAEVTPRQESREEVQSQHLRRDGIEYDDVDTVHSEHLKAESIGEADSMGASYGEERVRTRHEGSPDRVPISQMREVRWVEDTETLGAPAWHDQMHMHSSQARPRLPPARYHRPVYRRVLVDEAGYEVYEPPQYEHLQSYSPHLSSHPASPPLRRRRVHEPIYHHGSSSDDENNTRKSAAVPIRSTRTVTQRGGVSHDGLPHRMPMRGDVHEHYSRRGMKRRLDPYEVEEMYPRHRIIRRGSTSYDYMSDDQEMDFLLSGDDTHDETYSEASSPHQRRHLMRVPVSTQGTRGSQPGNSSSERDKREQMGDSEQAEAERQQEVEKLRVEETVDSSISVDGHSNRVETDAVPIEDKAECATTGAIQSKNLVDASVSIVFDGPGVESRTLPSDTESVAEVAIAPTTMLASGERVSGADDKAVSDQDESTRGGELTVGLTSATRGTSPVSYLLKSPVADSQDDRKPEYHLRDGRGKIGEDVLPSPAEELPHYPVLVSMKSQTPTTARAMLNDVMVKRFGSDSIVQSKRDEIRSRLVETAKNLAQLIDDAHSHERLQDLAHAAYRVQVEIGHLPIVWVEERHAMSATLDAAIKNAVVSTIPAPERVSVLQQALKEVMDSLSSDLPCSRDNETHLPCGDGLKEAPLEEIDQNHRRQLDEDLNPTCLEGQVKETGQTISEVAALAEEPSETKDRVENSKPKLTIPLEAPTFVSGLVTELERTTGLSAVMTSAQKRLLREISKSDPYYYLHPMALLDSVRKGRGSTCPFGCAGASAHKWERKVVSQISSRMKWFDSVAYSLAKVSGGKELLSRKKMNSTIRKLHLVALQLHCLIAHLFCVRKRVVCREIDSLPTALNNSYYEKRMNGYKSRLKLSLHQQLPPMSNGTALPTDELVRDTFEFYPELLLSIDIWGYDYRNDETATRKLPVDMLRAAARQSFDFETDTNGLLQGICEELLGILCLWNDFKWGESLESLSTDDIVEFEAKVKTSIRKILEAHASHLLSQWSIQLSSMPTLLNHIRLTQTNVYYSEQPVSVGAMAGCSFASQPSFLFRRAAEDEEDGNEEDKEEEDAVLHDFWRSRFPASTSSSDTEASDLAKPDVSAPLNLSPLREDDLVRGAQKKSDQVLSWTEVYDLRQKCHHLAGKTDRLLSESANPGSSSRVVADEDVLTLLKRLTQARCIVEDAISTSEKLVMHSVHHQLDETDAETLGAGTLADVESMSDCSRDEEDALVDALLAGTELKDRDSRADSPEQPEEEQGEDVWKQPVLKDLVEIVTSTNQEMLDICGQRARSARVRDKLQSQSLELARQSIQIFQTILNMKP